MKEQIYTIPVTDGFTEGGECPFCNMHGKLERDAIDFILGPAATYMESDVRDTTDSKGFCNKHFTDLYREPNALGLALIAHTHLRKVTDDLSRLGGSVAKAPAAKKNIFSRGSSNNSGTVSYINKILEGCCICDRINNTFARYIDTYFYLWVKESDIRTHTKESKGFCIRHFATLLEEGEKKLNAADYKEFLSIILPLQQTNMKRLVDELDWFTQKFDYRFVNEPWKDSKDSLHRAINKLSSAGLTE